MATSYPVDIKAYLSHIDEDENFKRIAKTLYSGYHLFIAEGKVSEQFTKDLLIISEELSTNYYSTTHNKVIIPASQFFKEFAAEVSSLGYVETSVEKYKHHFNALNKIVNAL